MYFLIKILEDFEEAMTTNKMKAVFTAMKKGN
jgi:hypothetical protein